MMDSFFSRKRERRQKDSLTFRKYSQRVDWFEERKKKVTQNVVLNTQGRCRSHQRIIIMSSCLVLSAGNLLWEMSSFIRIQQAGGWKIKKKNQRRNAVGNIK